jgi:hypothetical protein
VFQEKPMLLMATSGGGEQVFLEIAKNAFAVSSSFRYPSFNENFECW